MELGRPADALPSAREAVAIYRELASSDSDTHRLELAYALQNLGILYAELGRVPEAQLASAEAEALSGKS